jgi:hypothetical protein
MFGVGEEQVKLSPLKRGATQQQPFKVNTAQFYTNCYTNMASMLQYSLLYKTMLLFKLMKAFLDFTYFPCSLYIYILLKTCHTDVHIII